ncbi:hypothetical protein [Flavobacterium limi]|nr:hypothetical protein [Flavobacterium limi]
MKFPRLNHNPIRYKGQMVGCSVFGRNLIYKQTNQFWNSLKVGTDVLSLLVNLCSKECESKLPKPPENYIQFPHKGGADLKQPLNEDELFELEMRNHDDSQNENLKVIEIAEKQQFSILKLMRRVWKNVE